MKRVTIERRILIAAVAACAILPLPAFAAANAAPADAKPRVAIETERGVIVVELEAKKAPLTTANFLRYVDSGRYNGGQFFRASRTPGVAGGGTIQADAAPTARLFRPVAHESTQATGLRHKAGTISMARNAPGSATSGFFICASAQPFLDAHPGAKGDNQGFAAFGRVVEGMAVVRKILALPTNGKTSVPDMKGQILTTPVKIVSMKRLG